jgi:hypothetical protein
VQNTTIGMTTCPKSARHSLAGQTYSARSCTGQAQLLSRLQAGGTSMPIKREAGWLFDAISGEPIGGFEQRGDKRIETLFEDEGKPQNLADEFERLVAGARRELQAAGLPTDTEIVRAAELAGEDIVTALRDATDAIAKKEGHTSRLWPAMCFLTQRILLQIRVGNDYMEGREAEARGVEGSKAAAYVAYGALLAGAYFALALHDWHETFYNTDDAAYHGRRQAQRLTKGSGANRARKLGKWKVIVQAVGTPIDDNHVPCKVIAGRHEKINAALERAGYAPLQEAALVKTIERIRKERRRAGVAA